MASVTQIISNSRDLPTLPVVAAEILRITQDPNSSVRDLETVVHRDPPLAAKVLRLANSAFFSSRRKMSNLHEAIVFIGFASVRSIALALSVIDAFKSKKGVMTYFREEFWVHSYCTAALADHLARKVKGSNPNEAFVVGLLHDIGKLVIEIYKPAQFAEIVKTALDKKIATYEAEIQILGSTHARVGAKVMEEWNIGEAIVEGIRWHHSPSLARPEFRACAEVCHLADFCANVHRPAPEINPTPVPPEPSIWASAGLERDAVLEETKEIVKQAPDSLAALLRP